MSVLGQRKCEKIRLSAPLEIVMTESKEQKRTRLMAKAASVVDAYLEWEEKNPQPDLMPYVRDLKLNSKNRTSQLNPEPVSQPL